MGGMGGMPGMGGMGGMPGMGGMGGMPGMGGMGGMGGADLGGLGSVMNDPEILEALQDPDVQRAFAVRSLTPSWEEMCFENEMNVDSVSGCQLGSVETGCSSK